MKLLECYVENFGKLHHFHYKCRDGFNTILELNGWGKTTFTTFIKAMFYGMDASRRKNVNEDERRKYLPWQGGSYGGYIIFEINDKVYKLERFFGESITGDTFTLYDNKTGLESHDYSENIGEEIFKLDREAYSRSAFIPQQNVEIQANDSISTKLGNLIESENDMNNFDPAKEKLDRARKEYIKTGGRGKIALAENRLSELEEEQIKCVQKNKTAIEKNVEKKKIRERKEKIKEESDESERIATRLLTIQGEMKPYELSSQEHLRVEILRERFKDHIPSDAEVSAKDLALKTYHDNEIKLDMLRELLNKSEDQPQDNRLARSYVILLVLAPIIAVLGIIPTITTKSFIPMIICLCIAVVILVMAFFSKNKQQALLEEHQKKIDSHKESIAGFEAQQKEIISDLQKFLANYIEHEANSISELENQLKDLRNNRSEYLRIMDKSARYEELKNTKIEGHTLAEIQEKKKELAEEYDRITAEENKLLNQIESLNSFVQKSPEIEDEILSLKSFIKEAQNRYENLSIAMTCLDKAKEQIAIHYMDDMQKGFKKYIAILDNDAGLDKNVRMDTDLNVSVLDYGSQWSTEYFSAGYKDLIGVCARFALIDALFEDEKPFLVLDDPFVNLDSGKLTNALELVKKVATQYQIIYLTCHESRAEGIPEDSILRGAEFNEPFNFEETDPEEAEKTEKTDEVSEKNVETAENKAEETEKNKTEEKTEASDSKEKPKKSAKSEKSGKAKKVEEKEETEETID